MNRARFFGYFALLWLLSASFLVFNYYKLFTENYSSANETLPQYKIAIVVVLEPNSVSYYSQATETLKCYAQIHEYSLLILEAANYSAKCPHKDKFFKRHCVVSFVLPDYDYIMFLDGDIGVVNPKRKIEEFIDPSFDVTFYDRYWNWEIMAGAYLLKNTTYSLKFITDFADYEFRLPKSHHGTDNGALHMLVAEKLFSNRPEELKICRNLWSISKNMTGLFAYEACIRDLMGIWENFPPHIRVLKKGAGWARDGLITSFVWDPRRDFMLHSWKTKNLRNYTKKDLPIRPSSSGNMYSPFRGSFILDKCVPGNTTWNYDPNLISTTGEVQKALDKYRNNVKKDYYRDMKEISKRIDLV